MPDRRTHAPPSYPIATAPRVPGAPLLLWDRESEAWTVGYWDGCAWHTDTGDPIDPTHWSPLPDRPGV